jgi:hypothetical protein
VFFELRIEEDLVCTRGPSDLRGLKGTRGCQEWYQSGNISFLSVAEKKKKFSMPPRRER